MNKDWWTDFTNIIEKEGLKIIPGNQYFDTTLGNDKGTAVKILIDAFRKEFTDNVIFFGIGDSKNDESMLSLVDFPMLVQKFDGSWEDLKFDKLNMINGVGPKGWEIALDLVLKYQDTPWSLPCELNEFKPVCWLDNFPIHINSLMESKM